MLSFPIVNQLREGRRRRAMTRDRLVVKDFTMWPFIGVLNPPFAYHDET